MRLHLDDRSGAWEDRAAQPARTPSGWVPCPAVTAPAPLGAAVWSVRLYGRHVQGPDIEQEYGVTGGILTAPEALTVTVAGAEDVCQGLPCNHTIARGQACGSYMSTRYCCCCITVTEPASTLRNASGRVIPPLAPSPETTKETTRA